jgi:hypothetical protein
MGLGPELRGDAGGDNRGISRNKKAGLNQLETSKSFSNGTYSFCVYLCTFSKLRHLESDWNWLEFSVLQYWFSLLICTQCQVVNVRNDVVISHTSFDSYRIPAKFLPIWGPNTAIAISPIVYLHYKCMNIMRGSFHKERKCRDIWIPLKYYKRIYLTLETLTILYICQVTTKQYPP